MGLGETREKLDEVTDRTESKLSLLTTLHAGDGGGLVVKLQLLHTRILSDMAMTYSSIIWSELCFTGCRLPQDFFPKRVLVRRPALNRRTPTGMHPPKKNSPGAQASLVELPLLRRRPRGLEPPTLPGSRLTDTEIWSGFPTHQLQELTVPTH